MVLNQFVIKKWVAIILMPMIPVICFYVGVAFYNLLYGLMFMFVGIMLAALCSNLLLKHPFRSMVEGAGLMVINIDSTGIIRPYIFGVKPPLIVGKVDKQPVQDIWNRATVMQIATPKEVKEPAQALNDGGIEIKLDEKQYNENRFALFHYPVLIYNRQIGSFLTKDYFADLEKNSFAEHTVLYLNRLVEGLSSVTRDFARHVVEQLKPKEGFFKSKWVWIIAIALMVMLALLFVPQILETLGVSGFFGGAQQALDTASQTGQTITPR